MRCANPFIVSILLPLLWARCACGGEAMGAIDDAEAKLVAIRAVTAMFLRSDLEELEELVDPTCAVNAKGPGQKDRLLAGIRDDLRRMGEGKLSGVLSLREMRFFVEKDIPALRERFPTKRDLWSDAQAPAYITGGLGCCVVARELHNGKETDAEVYVLVIRRVGGKPKVVFYGNS